MIPGSTRRAIRRKLLAWYGEHQRDLPWRRRADDPYAQWVAEVMLQQTRVDTVMRYYGRFLTRFPTVRALARAEREEVLKFWEGLGYYRRIHHLHRAVIELSRNGARVPSSEEELRRLPGVGEYTAAAIASIAYREPVAAVDGNVARIISRLFAVEQDVLSTPGRTRIGDLAGQLLPQDRPGDFNQAWMDLASGTCTPRRPKCDLCPLSKHCRSFRAGSPEHFPVRGSGRAVTVPTLDLVVTLFLNDDRILMRRRAEGGLWSGLWEPPNLPFRGRGKHVAVNTLAEELGMTMMEAPEWLPAVAHRLTHRRLRLHPVRVGVDVPALRVDMESVRWVGSKQLLKLAVPVAFRKVLKAAGTVAGLRARPVR